MFITNGKFNKQRQIKWFCQAWVVCKVNWLQMDMTCSAVLPPKGAAMALSKYFYESCCQTLIKNCFNLGINYCRQRLTHFLWDFLYCLACKWGVTFHFEMVFWSQTMRLLPIKYWNRLNCCQTLILFLRPFQPLLFCFWWDPFVMSGHLLCSVEPPPAFKQTSASGTGLLVPWANESMTVPVMS